MGTIKKIFGMRIYLARDQWLDFKFRYYVANKDDHFKNYSFIFNKTN